MMLSRADTFNVIADRVRAASSPLAFEEAIIGLKIHFRVSKRSIADGLRERGVILAADDMLKVSEPAPERGDFTRFIAAVTQRLQTGARPIHTDALLMNLELPDAAIPYRDLAGVLTSAGLFHFPGAGWWTEPQWTDNVGNFYSASGGEKVQAVMNVFNEYGWPLHVDKVVALTGGKISQSYFDRHNPAIACYFRNIGLRFVIPTIEAHKGPVPMSPAMAANMLALTPADLLTRRHSFAAYGIAYLLARHGMASVKRANTRLKGEKQTQTIRMDLTPKGRAALTEMAKGFSAEAHEVI